MLALSFILFLLLASSNGLLNVTVDDSSSQISYSPEGSWRTGQSCGDCDAHPEVTLALEHSWHDGVYRNDPKFGQPTSVQTANVSFNGSAIYAFGIVPAKRRFGFSYLTFYIDGEVVGHFTNNPPGGDSFQYNVTLYSNDSLSMGPHTFALQNGPTVDDSGQSLVLLDYLVYSTSDNNSSTSPAAASGSSSSSPAGKIAGGVIGGLAVIPLAAIGFFFWQKRRRNEPLLPVVRVNVRRWFTPKTDRRPVAFNPAMMVHRPGPSEPARQVDLVSGGGISNARPQPPMSGSTQRILAWQRQTADAQSNQPNSEGFSTGLPPPSEGLSSYWDQSSESFKNWEARATSPTLNPAPGPSQPPQSPPQPPPPTKDSTPLPPPPPPPIPAAVTSPQDPSSPRRSRPRSGRAIRRFTVMNN